MPLPRTRHGRALPEDFGNLATKGTTQTPENGAGAKRLDEKAWIIAALKKLATHGIDGVRVELLARELGVTKGSFYWHFKDRNELRAAMLDYWRSRATVMLIERMDQSGVSPTARLEQLIELVVHARSRWGDEVELALRMWARQDPRAQATLAEVDQLRVRYIANLLADAGELPPVRASRVYLKLGDQKKAEELANQAVNSGKDQVLPLANLADIQWRAGKRDEAKATFEKLRPHRTQCPRLPHDTRHHLRRSRFRPPSRPARSGRARRIHAPSRASDQPGIRVS